MDQNIEKFPVVLNRGKNYRKNSELFDREFENIKREYPNLHYRNTEDGLVLEGEVSFDLTHTKTSERIRDSYIIRIMLEDFPKMPPKVFEIGNKISENFHKDLNGLCLGVRTEVYLKFKENPSILYFIHELLEPFLYSYSYWKKHNGVTPFGQRQHNGKGILEYYSEMFATKDNDIIIDLLETIIKGSLKQSIPCPCGSKKKFKKCNRKIILKIHNSVPREILRYEYEQIRREIYSIIKIY